jgi:hypothetical protein
MPIEAPRKIEVTQLTTTSVNSVWLVRVVHREDPARWLGSMCIG